ncbi:hypothetical protein DFS34DRAFT_161035 [Phlyctochytrium arcticum]|nr:hypothetical protein DFS34DRAFT_161035 [Phlyctochytrium arcticum]
MAASRGEFYDRPLPIVVHGKHDFNAEEEDEISFGANEPVVVLERDEMYNDGWWRGRNHRGQTGLFPVNFVNLDPSSQPMSPLSVSSVDTVLSASNDRLEPIVHNNRSASPQPKEKESSISNYFSRAARRMSFDRSSKQLPNITSNQAVVTGTLKSLPHSVHPTGWAADQVGKWLADVGFSHTIPIFEENTVNGKRLLELNLSTLRELGLESLGDRINLLHCILALREESAAMPLPQKVPEDATAKPPRPSDKDNSLAATNQTKEVLQVETAGPDRHVPSKVQSQDSGFATEDDTLDSESKWRFEPLKPMLPEMEPETEESPSNDADERLRKTMSYFTLSDYYYDLGTARSTKSKPSLDTLKSVRSRMEPKHDTDKSSPAANNESDDNLPLSTSVQQSASTVSPTPPPRGQSFDQPRHRNPPTETNKPSPIVPGVSISGSYNEPSTPSPKLQESPISTTNIGGMIGIPMSPILEISSSLRPPPKSRSNRIRGIARNFSRNRTDKKTDSIPSLDAAPRDIERHFPSPDFSGYLSVRADSRRSWKKRWCILNGDMLHILKSQDEPRLVAEIPLTKNCQILPDSDPGHGKFAFMAIHPASPTFHFVAESQLAMVSWINALVRAGQQTVRTKPVPLIPIKNNDRLSRIPLSAMDPRLSISSNPSSSLAANFNPSHLAFTHTSQLSTLPKSSRRNSAANLRRASVASSSFSGYSDLNVQIGYPTGSGIRSSPVTQTYSPTEYPNTTTNRMNW